jgi:hypothetical protein
MKQARRSFGESYNCKQEWPEDCFVQCGGNGIVLTEGSISDIKDTEDAVDVLKAVAGRPNNKKHYRTAFFEAFPKTPSCFLRGEGGTVEEAEESCFKKFQKILSCSHTEFDRRGREDGYAFCKTCPYSGTLLAPLTTCTQCEKPTHEHQDAEKRWHCDPCYFALDVDHAVGKDRDLTEEDLRSFFGTIKEYREQFLDDQAQFKSLTFFGYSPGDSQYKKLKDVLMKIVVSLEFDLKKKSGNVFNENPAGLAELKSNLKTVDFHHALILAAITQFPDLKKE